MPLSSYLLSPGNDFWPEVARTLLGAAPLARAVESPDGPRSRVLVPTFVHAQHLKAALAEAAGKAWIPPRITTLTEWLAFQLPDTSRPMAETERLMLLYAGLRQQPWLKKIFVARRNTDLLPLAKMLLMLSDELTASLLPSLQQAPDSAEQRWRSALEKISPKALTLLSDESQLVWSIWQSQLDASDACAVRYRRMMSLATVAVEPLIWISPVEPDPIERAFLDAYAAQQPVTVISLDWRRSSVPPVMAACWPELLCEPEDNHSLQETGQRYGLQVHEGWRGLSLYPASSLEDEAAHGAQTVVDWLAAGKSRIAVVAQDRVVARRMRALLDRAHVAVADETGWKLSTTRAAAALAGGVELMGSRGDMVNLLDFLKSPFVLPALPGKADQVLQIELRLRAENLLGWDAFVAALAPLPSAQEMLLQLTGQVPFFSGRKTLCEWAGVTADLLDALAMRDALAADAAGVQVIRLLDAIAQDCSEVDPAFSFPEWKAFLDLQLESTSFLLSNQDQRVVMLPLNGARLRAFDAVLLVGADAAHLPSQQKETLFFANAVRHELGLTTRESRHRQQLRDFAELLMANEEVVLSWQAHKGGESNPQSPWIARLQLTLAQSGLPLIGVHQAMLATQQLHARAVAKPAPVAPALLPTKLSASGYNSLVACPYQFFATRMLRLSALDEFSELPQKRDYGDWLHQILKAYHDMVRDQNIDVEDRLPALKKISDDIFGKVLDANPAALGYSVRWQKVMPAYLDWANQREAQGWQFDVGERWFEKPLEWDGGSVMLHGRVDRIDRKPGASDSGEQPGQQFGVQAAEYALLDYKTTDSAALRKRLQEKEDHQLPFYGLLTDVPVQTAAFVALDATKGKTGAAEAADYEAWQQALQLQIASSLQAIGDGTPMPATGIASTCQYCAVRGLCRKGGWS